MSAMNFQSAPRRWVHFIELTRLGTIKMPFGDAYLWIICEVGGAYFSKTDYMWRAMYFEAEQTAQEFLEVFPFVQGKVFAGLHPDRHERRSLSNSFEKNLLFHLFSYGVLSHFQKGLQLWTPLLSGLLQAKSQASDPPSRLTELKCPTASKSVLNLAASFSSEPSDSPQLSLW